MENEHHFVKTEVTVVMKTFIMHSNKIRGTSFCHAITYIYGEMALKFFINTIAKLHVMR